MTRKNGIILTAVLVGILALASIVFAQEMMQKTEEKEGTRPPAMERGRWRMGGGPGPGMMGMGHGRGPMMRRGRGMDSKAPMSPGQGRGRMAGHMGMLIHLADKLELSEEQKAEIKEVFAGHQKAIISIRADLEIAEVELRELMMREDPNLDAIEDQLRNVANLQVQMRFSQIKALADARSVLTEEQKETQKEMFKNRAAGMRGRGRGRTEMRGPQPGPERGRRGRG